MSHPGIVALGMSRSEINYGLLVAQTNSGTLCGVTLGQGRSWSRPRRSRSRSFIDQTTSLANFHFDFKLVELSIRKVRKVVTLSSDDFRTKKGGQEIQGETTSKADQWECMPWQPLSNHRC